jgi:hypothetical protein
MNDPTIPAHLDYASDHRISSSSGLPLPSAKAAPCVLDLLGQSRPQVHAAMESLI